MIDKHITVYPLPFFAFSFVYTIDSKLATRHPIYPE